MDKDKKEDPKARYEADSEETKEQAEALLKDYYRRQGGEGMPKRPMLASWKLKEDGVMIVVDGASGRELTFEPKDYLSEDKAEEEADDAAQAVLDAEEELSVAKGALKAAELKVKTANERAIELSKAAKRASLVASKPFKYIDDELVTEDIETRKAKKKNLGSPSQ